MSTASTANWSREEGGVLAALLGNDSYVPRVPESIEDTGLSVYARGLDLQAGCGGWGQLRAPGVASIGSFACRSAIGVRCPAHAAGAGAYRLGAAQRLSLSADRTGPFLHAHIATGLFLRRTGACAAVGLHPLLRSPIHSRRGAQTTRPGTRVRRRLGAGGHARCPRSSHQQRRRPIPLRVARKWQVDVGPLHDVVLRAEHLGAELHRGRRSDHSIVRSGLSRRRERPGGQCQGSHFAR